MGTCRGQSFYQTAPFFLRVRLFSYIVLSARCALYFKESAKNHISGRIAADYRSDIGADFSYRDFVRLIHIKYEWGWKEETIQKLNMRARGQIITQNQSELSCERFFKMEKIHDEIDRQPDLKSK